MVWAMTEHLATLRLAIDTGMLVLFWLVQLVIYPAFAVIEDESFKSWHHHYMYTISIIVVPLISAQAICTTLATVSAPNMANIICVLAMLVAWVVTFTVSVPCHHRLQEHGNRPDLVRRIVQSNWIRTAAWSIVFGAALG